jgi:hypothetical protein
MSVVNAKKTIGNILILGINIFKTVHIKLFFIRFLKYLL